MRAARVSFSSLVGVVVLPLALLRSVSASEKGTRFVKRHDSQSCQLTETMSTYTRRERVIFRVSITAIRTNKSRIDDEYSDVLDHAK